MEPSLVVAISGMSGAGKSSLVRAVRARLPDSASLHFDDYAAVSRYPPDLRAWLDRGADVDEWEIPHFTADLRRLRAGEPVVPPGAEAPVEAAPVLLLEQPLGRGHRDMGTFVDLSVYIDVPLDLLLLRRLQRRLGEERAALGDRLEQQLAEDLAIYLAVGRDLTVTGHARLRGDADLVVDGHRPVAQLADEVCAAIHARRPGLGRA